MKKFLLLILLGGLAYAGLYTYSVYSHAETIKKQATAVIDEYNWLKVDNRVYEKERAKLRNEQKRCTEYIAQDSGDFGEFEYCKRYLKLITDFELES